MRPRTLDLQEKQFNFIFHPVQFAPLEQTGSAINLGAAVIGHNTLALQATAQAQVFELRISCTQVNLQHVIRRGVQRIAVALGFDAAALEQGFVITGDHPLFAAVRVEHLIGGEPFFIKCAQRSAASRPKLLGAGAYLLPVRFVF